MKRRRRTYNYKFTEKTHSKKGIWGLILAIVSILLGIVMVMISFQNQGNGMVYLGSGGVLSLLLALVALLLAFDGMHEEDRYRVFPMAATVVSLISLAGWIALYIIGLLEI